MILVKILIKTIPKVAVLFAFSSLTSAQPIQSNNASLSIEEQRLINSRIANEEAQAEYYRVQTEKLRAAPTPTPSPASKTFQQSLSENPTAAVGVIGAIVAAFITALVALLSLFVNRQATLQNQRDTQFYEALKRFGDTDSSMVRLSATNILVQMASLQQRSFKFWPPKLFSVQQYFNTALNQLITGSILEENELGLFIIRDALVEMIDINPGKCVQMILNANGKLEQEVVENLASFFVTSGAASPEPISAVLLDQAGALTPFHKESLRFMMGDSSNFFSTNFIKENRIFEVLSDEEKLKHKSLALRKLPLSAFRLKRNIEVFSYAIKKDVTFVKKYVGGGAVLIGAKLDSLDLTRVKFNKVNLAFVSFNNTYLSKAQFQRAILYGANLKDADLSGAQLQGAILDNANMTNTKLYGAQLNERTKLQNVNWWTSNFYNNENKKEVDTQLLQFLYEHYKQSLPEDLTMVHPSVLDFVNKK